MSRERKNTANFGPKSDTRSGISQVAAKGEMGRGSFQRATHHGGNNRDTEFVVERASQEELNNNPEIKLRWLQRIEESRRQTGRIPKAEFENIADAYFFLAGFRPSIFTEAEAKSFFEELLAVAKEDVGAKKQAELIVFNEFVTKLKKNRVVRGDELIDLLKSYREQFGALAHQKVLLRIRSQENTVDVVIDIAEQILARRRQELEKLAV